MVYVYGYRNGNANAAVDEYQTRYLLRITPNRAVFTNMFCALRECETLPSVHVSSERRSIQTVEEQEEIVSMVQRSPTTSTRRIASRLVFHKVACGEHCITMACIHFTISQYNICTQVMTHNDCNFVIGYPITESYCRTFYLQMRPHLLVTVLLIPATLIIGRGITLMLPFKQISKHGSP